MPYPDKYYCPWSGKSHCGCTQFPFYDDRGLMPETCQTHLSIPQMEQHKGRITPERAAEAQAWVKAGRPNLRVWHGEQEDGTDGE